MEGILVDSTRSGWIVVNWAWVHVRKWLLLGDGLEPEHRHLDCQLHDIWLAKRVGVMIPLGTLEVEPGDVGTIFRMLLDLGLRSVDRSELECQLINRCLVGLTRQSLHEAGGETGWECEGTEPVDERCTLSGPKGEEIVSLG